MRPLVSALAFLSLTLLAACTADPVEAPREISSVVVGATTTMLTPGSSSYILYSVYRSSSFIGDVRLSAEDVPVGIVATFTPSTLHSGEELAQLSIVATVNAPAGSYTINTRVRGDGVETKTIPITVVVAIPAVTMSVGTTASTLAQGQTTSIPITIERAGGYTGTVGLSVLGLPAGVTATLDPVVLHNGELTSTLTLSASLDAAVTVVPITIRAAAQGIADKTADVQVTVAPTTTPAITGAATAIAVPRGKAGQSTLTISRYAGYTGPVNLAFENVPPGVTVTAPPIADGSNTTTATFTASLDAPVDAFTLDVRASGSGIQSITVPLRLQVLPMPEFFFSFPGYMGGGVYGPNLIARSVIKGDSVSLFGQVVNVTNFAEPVSLSLIGLPPGVTSSMVSTVVPISFLGFSLLTTGETPVGTHTITIRGVATSGMTREGTILLTVLPP